MVKRNGIGAKFFILASVIVVNSLGVLYFARDSVNLPQFLHLAFELKGASNQESTTSSALISQSDISFGQNSLVAIDNSEVRYTRSNSWIDEHEAPHTYKCLDKMKPPERKIIYTWTDGKGVKHISDSPRKLNSNTSVQVAKIINPEAISLNFLSHNLPFDVQRAVRGRVQEALDAFAPVTPIESMVPVVANIRSFSDKGAYEKYSKRFNLSTPKSTGFYSSGRNESAILIRGNKETLQTITHEVIHTINRYWYGQVAKWLNEGMAEYSESPGSLTNSAWVNHFKSNQPLALTTLFEGTESSWRQDPHQFYASSWAFVAFLMSDNQDFMSRLLLLESENGCEELSMSDIQRLYGRNIATLNSDFRRWFRSKLQ
ncbi:DUF4124 domain-containing protein [Alteromonas sp. KUL106]|uniref:DUF4124 domain-containing protein n=1 Tax=Alteromonas sp. KUL106 TaxID=2480799 RepID=UPI0012E6BA6A|nr:DUF4124 domain-containing protein [Alteromonas sp. KUL106]GFD68967.1 hypothetical protein KUL106_22300 [Alteromonas sp. KUL106]